MESWNESGGRVRRPFHRSIVPSFRSGHVPCQPSGRPPGSPRHVASRGPHGRILALLLGSGVGTIGHRAPHDGRGVRGVGGCDGDDDAEGAAGSELHEADRLVEPQGQAPGGAGLARALGLQSSILRRGGLRVRAPAGLSRRPEDSGVPARHRVQPAAAVNPAPLGVFDSGIGGLTVARALFERLPGESVIYFGDTARVPYGPKSPDTVRRYSAEILAYLLGRGVKAVVVACNTSTAHALGSLQQHAPVPVVGVIEPGARAAVAATKTGTIGVIGTAGTIASGAYDRGIKALRT